MDAFDLLENVVDRESFLAFVRALIADRRHDVRQRTERPIDAAGPGPNGWENDTIEDYLESAVACAEDSAGKPVHGPPQSPSWREFAEFLYGGKIYE